MQSKMKETQEALKKIEVEGISGGNAVKVIINGKFPIISIVIKNKTKEFKKIANIVLFHIF